MTHARGDDIMNYSYRDELYHHGILGQRWGKKNGPPYPLQPGNHSNSEIKAGWKKSLKSDPDLLEKKRAVKEAKKSSKLNQKKPACCGAANIERF